MKTKITVIKATGEEQQFLEEKLRDSLKKAGASDTNVEFVIREITKYLYDGITTGEIYRKAYQLLRKKVRSNAARYSLKRAIMELGPSGYPFERFVGELFKKQGYKTEVGVVVQGRCVQHEVDVVAENDTHTVMVECKYHNAPGKNSSVQVPLYVRSRFNDIEAVWQASDANLNRQFVGYLFTNTRFTTDATDYGNCAGLRLVGWDYPRQGGLKELIEKTALYPVTVITSLNTKHKQLLLHNNILLCSELRDNPGYLDQLSLTHLQREKTLVEVYDLCLV